MSAPDRLFRLDLPDDEESPAPADVVALFPGATSDSPTADVPPAEADEEPQQRSRVLDRVQPAVERFTTGWRAAWVGDGLLGMRPRPVADLVRQFWTEPPAYVRDALFLRIPYALYGVPVVVFTAAAHLVLLIISYFSLLIATCLVVLFISFFV